MNNYGHAFLKDGISGSLRGLLLCGLLLVATLEARAQASTPRMPQRQNAEGATLYSIEGNVLPPDTRSPVGQARVTLSDMKGRHLGTQVTDDEGMFAFYDLPVGVYTVNVTHALHEEANERVEVTVTALRDVRVVMRSHGVKPNLPGNATLAVWAQRIPAEARKEYEAGVKEMQSGDRKKSIEHFEAAISLYPEYAAAYSAMGTARLRLEQRKEAVAAFESALKIDENLLDANLGLGALHSAEKRYAEAEKYLLRARLVKPDEWRILYELGSVYSNLGNWAGAEENLGRAKALHAELPRIHLLLLNALTRQEKYKESLAAMEEFLRRFPLDPFAAQVRQKHELLKAHVAKEAETAKKP
ncbi:MAG TPA: tetratricopeptide repeat protein [Candidatus Acidoferrales bacterium]